jgi:hypothetical protein
VARDAGGGCVGGADVGGGGVGDFLPEAAHSMNRIIGVRCPKEASQRPSRRDLGEAEAVDQTSLRIRTNDRAIGEETIES